MHVPIFPITRLKKKCIVESQSFSLEEMTSKRHQALLNLGVVLAATPVDIFNIYRASLTDRLKARPAEITNAWTLIQLGVQAKNN